MAFLALGLALLATVLLAGRAFVAADPVKLAGFLRSFGLALLVLLGLLLAVFLLVTGRFVIVALPIGLFASWLARGGRLGRLGDLWRRAGGAAPRSVSEVETRYLRMSLDHETGVMSGTIRAGPHTGRRLAELDQGELLALWRECRAEDEPSASLLESYLDHAAPGWRDAASGAGAAQGQATGEGGREGAQARGGGGAAMTREEAYKILGLAEGASQAQIKAAHRQLMLKLHPDHGGSSYLAAQINRARDLLRES